MVLIHVSKDRSIKETRALFRLASSKTDNIDCEEKELLLTFDDASMRNRKKRVRGGSSYSCRSALHFFSPAPLVPSMVPEKAFQHYSGFNSSDVLGFIHALQPSDMWHADRLGSDGLYIILPRQPKTL